MSREEEAEEIVPVESEFYDVTEYRYFQPDDELHDGLVV